MANNMLAYFSRPREPEPPNPRIKQYAKQYRDERVRSTDCDKHLLEQKKAAVEQDAHHAAETQKSAAECNAEKQIAKDKLDSNSRECDTRISELNETHKRIQQQLHSLCDILVYKSGDASLAAYLGEEDICASVNERATSLVDLETKLKQLNPEMEIGNIATWVQSVVGERSQLSSDNEELNKELSSLGLRLQSAQQLSSDKEDVLNKLTTAEKQLRSCGLSLQQKQVEHAGALQKIVEQLKKCKSKDTAPEQNKQQSQLQDDLTTKVAELTKAVEKCEKDNLDRLNEGLEFCQNQINEKIRLHNAQTQAHKQALDLLKQTNQAQKTEIRQLTKKLLHLQQLSQAKEYDLKQLDPMRMSAQVIQCRQELATCRSQLDTALKRNVPTQEQLEELDQWRRLAGCEENDKEICMKAIFDMKTLFGRR